MVRVLILVLLENALRDMDRNLFGLLVIRLNPCFVGKCSTRKKRFVLMENKQLCLNPCFVGKCSTSAQMVFGTIMLSNVLILVLLENALREKVNLEQSSVT